MVMEMCYSFLQAEVMPILDRIDSLEPGLMPSLMDKAGPAGAARSTLFLKSWAGWVKIL